ncbi:MAG: FAD-dependent oxidoreductase, partial [Syntrophorhabdus aromaticivorans]|nr:FAD-dependent oxidoreductase [Syntrophorhabdus aromaticivorans]
RMIAEGKCDYVYIARALIADPHFPRKAMEGREEDITPCIYCNQGCVFRSFNRATTNGIRCTVNPTAGEEARWGSWTFEKAPKRKNILVVGAGPAGLQCAMVAAQRGHNVVVYEKEEETGGQARLIKNILDHTMPQTFLDYLNNQVRKVVVKINFGTEITEANIDSVLEKEKPDAIALATGARPARDGRGSITTEPIPGWDRKNVCTYLDIVLGTVQPGDKVLIVDELADRITPGIAEMLAEQGKTVEVVTRWFCLSQNLHYWLDEMYVMGRLDELGVKINPNAWAKVIHEKGATCFNIHSGREFEVEADTVVLSTMKYSNTDLYDLFRERGVECHLIGDAKAPRWILNATHDGYKLGREL